MNIYESAEDYLERILILKEEKGHVKSIDIANSMNYSKPSISRAMKNLRENDYITINEKGEIDLTPKGFAIADKIFTRHKVLSNFFMKIGVNNDIALKDACKVEHDLSDETFEKLVEYLKKN